MSMANSFSDDDVPDRYRDGYSNVQLIGRLGSIVKVAGVILALVLLLLSFIGRVDGSWKMLAIGGPILGIVVGGLLLILGVIVSAIGQILQAVLDTAVNTSPFMSDEQKIRVMDF